MSQPTHVHQGHAVDFPSSAPRLGSGRPYASDENWITFGDLVRVFRVKRNFIFGVAVVVSMLATSAAFLMTPLYTGSALVMVDLRQNHLFDQQDNGSILSALPVDTSSIDSQVQVLKSHALIGQVVDKLNLSNNSAFEKPRTGVMEVIHQVLAPIMSLMPGRSAPTANRDGLSTAQVTRERTISKLLSDLNIYAIGHSAVIEIDVRVASAALAAKIANTIADTYVQNQTTARTNASKEASIWLADRVQKLSRQAAIANAAVEQYKVKHGIMDTSSGTSLTDQQLGDLTSQLILAEANEADAQAKIARVRHLVNSGRSADVTEVIDSPLITELREQETTLLQQKADLSSRYGPLYPKMRDIDAQLRELKDKIGEEVTRVVGTVSNGVAVAAAHVAALKKSMSKLRSETNTQNQARIDLAGLEAKANSTQELYQTYLARFRQTQQQTSLKAPDVHVASEASVPLKPSFPNKLLIIAAAIPGGLLLGFLAALIAERMCSGFRSANDLEDAAGIPVLGVVPELKVIGSGLKATAMEVAKHPQSQYSEAVRGLEINVSRHRSRGKGGQVIVVTSALPAEGKTTTAASLARRLALTGYRVVAVDADLRRPKLGAALGVRKSRYSLTDFLTKRCSLDDVLSADPHSPLVALTASFTTDPASHIGSPEMANLIDRLRKIADFVVIDTPPVLAVHDSKLLAKMADCTLLVVRWQSTPRDAVSSVTRSLADFDVHVTGTALVRADAKHYPYYAYGYGGAPSLVSYYEG